MNPDFKETTHAAAKKDRGPPPPIPYHSKPVYGPRIKQEQPMTDQPSSALVDLNPTTERLSYALVGLDFNPPTPATVKTSSTARDGVDSDEEYWRHVDNFDADSLDSMFSSLTVSSDPRRINGPETEISYPLPAHPVTPRGKKKFYCITRGRAVGIFDSWLIAKPYVHGIDAVYQSFTTVEEAWRIFDQCRELGTLEIITTD